MVDFEEIAVLTTEMVYGRELTGDKGKVIADAIAKANRREPTLLATWEDPEEYTATFLDREMWFYVLTLYENNQLVLSDRLGELSSRLGRETDELLLDTLRSDVRTTIEALNSMECWFSRVLEPPPAPLTGRRSRKVLQEWKLEMDEWWSREEAKYRGYSWYCSIPSRQYIALPEEVIDCTRELHRQLRRHLKSTHRW